jgi:Domain of unknown function (DUF4421)
MKCFKIFFLLLFVLPFVANAQYYDKSYIKDLRFRLLLSYFQENRNIDLNFKPNTNLGVADKENLLLSTSSNLYSGLLVQTNFSSLYLASTLPQTTSDIKKFGTQSSKIYKIDYVQNAVSLSFNYVRNNGFYDKNYALHPEFANDTLTYRRHNSTSFQWINFDVNYYKNHKQFAIGMPTYFGLRQLKTKFSLGGKFAYNYIKIDNDNRSFFRDNVSLVNAELNSSKYVYNGVNFSVSPSLHLVAFKKMFLYTDLSVGLDLGFTKSESETQKTSKPYVNIAFPQAKIILGYQSNRFITSLYYTFSNQTIKTDAVTIGSTYNSFGFIIGYRFNLYKNLPWEKD